MRQVIYVDELLFINTVVNYFLLLTTCIFLKSHVNKFRILLGALTGGLFSLCALLPAINVALSVLMRVVIASVLVLITFGFRQLSFFVKHFLTLFFSTMLFAGIMSAIWIIFKADSLSYINGAFYFDINIFVLIISSVVSYFLIYIFKKFFKPNCPQAIVYEAEVEIFDKKSVADCFLDTGNNLTESFSSFPVIVATENFCKNIIPQNILQYLESKEIDKIDDENWRKRIRIINCMTVSGRGTMIAFRPDKIYIKNKSKTFETNEVYIAINTKQKYLNEKFDVLLTSEIFERKKNG